MLHPHNRLRARGLLVLDAPVLAAMSGETLPETEEPQALRVLVKLEAPLCDRACMAELQPCISGFIRKGKPFRCRCCERCRRRCRLQLLEKHSRKR